MIYSKTKRSIRFLAISLFIATVIACAPRTTQKKEVTTPPAPVQILSLTTQEDAAGFHVQVNASNMLTFTSVKQPSPLGVVFYFPETVIGTPQNEYEIDDDTVGAVQFSKMSADVPTTRMEISLKRDVPYEVDRDGNELRISFKKSIQTAEKKTEEAATSDSMDKSVTPAGVFKSLTTQRVENGIEVLVKADGTIKNFHSFAVDEPARIVFDMFDLRGPQEKENQISVGTPWAERIRYYGYPDRLRVVVETHKDYLNAYTARSVKDGLTIRITGAAGETVSKAVDKPQDKAPRTAPKEGPTGGGVVVDKSEGTDRSSTSAWVNRIDFSSEPEGKSTIIIGTTRPVDYDLKKISDKKLQLQLFNTRLPDYRQRPLITTRFQSAVDRITPFHSAAAQDTALISIEMRETVPYLVEHKDNILQIRFEASSISPRPVDQAKLPKWEGSMAEATAGGSAVGPSGTRAGQKPDPVRSASMMSQTGQQDSTGKPPRQQRKVYTGQKIALDFYETDIKNVFRILREVSGKNFAIDPGVTGKVTISLSDPVPWDAVLDLILDMNGLGKVEEAGIIRIARRDTINAEAAAEKAAAEAELAAQKQEKALEPLVTEYIPINYVNAETDVMPHIQNLLTPERGSVTVDTKNNQLIITDTRETINQARQTIQEIDQVTPQVLIEGRIVEASSSFSRELGAQLAVEISDIVSSNFGDFDVGMAANNPPAQSNGSIGFDFQKLTGTPLRIQATLIAAESEGQIKIISSPKVLTLDNRTARILQGTQVPVPTRDDSGNTVIEYRDVNLELEVTPHVTRDKRISMVIKIANNDVGELINGQTSFTTKEATTELLVSDGETVVIGGIRKARREDNESGVPGLMKVPMLGWLFKTQAKREQLQELLIFITPRIVQLEQRSPIESLTSSTAR